MKGLTVGDAAKITGGVLVNCTTENCAIEDVVIDSRKASCGSMFAALKGEHVDGHEYIAKAFEQGAVCALAERVPEGVHGIVIVVPDVREALRTLAESYRMRFDIPVIGITGSVGKTTAKEMTASVLGQRFNVLKTEKNLNNELGVPLTLFRLDDCHEAAVIEMGISDFGEMSRLAKMARPTMAIYTLIGYAHLVNLHDRNGVLKAKTEMVPYLPDGGTVFLNADDDMLCEYECDRRRVLFGTNTDAFVKAENIRSAADDGTNCDIVCGERRIPVHIPAYGKHMVYAALPAAAVGIEMGLTDDEISRGIAEYKTVGRRANIIKTDHLTLIDDCYNANPDSVKCAIDSLSGLSGRKVCIFGDMLEMGENVSALHSDVGRYAEEQGVELLLTVGEKSKLTSIAAENIVSIHFKSNNELIDKLPELIKKGDTVLVKASNGMHFDEISEALKLLN